MSLAVLGLSHRTAPIEVRERFHVEGDGVAPVLSRIVSGPSVRECVVLSTCNRTEYYYTADDEPRAERHLVRTLSSLAGFPEESVERHLFRHRERDAVVHLFRVASGLDSLVVGEPQIQGQVGDAYRLVRELLPEGVGSVLHRLFQSALAAGGRVRSRTRLAEGSASVPSAAVALARKVHGSLEGRRVVVVGTGEMGVLTLQCLMAEGVGRAWITSRSVERACSLARRFGAESLAHEEFWNHLRRVDLVVASTHATRPFLSAERIRAARRSAEPLVILDIALPRNVEAAAGDLPGVFLYNIDDLQAVVEAAEAARSGEIPTAEAIVREEAERFWRWYRARLAAPLIREMRARAEETRRREIGRVLAEIGSLSAEDRRRIDMASRAALNKILHVPTTALREMAKDREGERLLEAARRLLGLDGDGEGEAASGGRERIDE